MTRPKIVDALPQPPAAESVEAPLAVPTQTPSAALMASTVALAVCEYFHNQIHCSSFIDG
jgi:hypothetical protein